MTSGGGEGSILKEPGGRVWAMGDVEIAMGSVERWREGGGADCIGERAGEKGV